MSTHNEIKTEERSFCDLPLLPLEKIHKYLSVEDRRNLGLTSKHNLCVYRNLTEWIFDNLCERHLVEFSKNIRNIRKLVLKLYAGSPDVFKSLLLHHSEIQRLEIESSYELGLSTLLEILVMPSLRDLTFQSYGDFHRNSSALTVRSSTPQGTDSIRSTAVSGNLESLKLDLNGSCSEQTLLHVLQMIGSDVKHLHLFSKVTDGILNYVAKHLHQLNVLILENFEMCIQGLLAVLQNCRNLTDLTIGPRWQLPWTQLERSWEAEMAVLCPMLSNLRLLALTFHCQLSAATLTAVASNCTGLRTLVLWPPVTPELFMSLCQHFKALQKLEVNVGDVFPHQLIDIIDCLPQLKHLCIRRSYLIDHNCEHNGGKTKTLRHSRMFVVFIDSRLTEPALVNFLDLAPCIEQVHIAQSKISDHSDSSEPNLLSMQSRVVIDGVLTKSSKHGLLRIL